MRKLRSDGRVTQKAEYVTVDEFIQWGLADATVRGPRGSTHSTGMETAQVPVPEGNRV